MRMPRASTELARRSVLTGTLAAIAAGTLASCGSLSSSTPPVKTLYAWISNANDREQWQAFIDAARTVDPGFELHLEGPSFSDYWIKVKTRMSSSGAPALLTTQAARTQEISPLLAPLEPLAEQAGVNLSQYNSAMLEGMTVDGSLRAIPYDAEPMVLYVNRELFANANRELPPLHYTRDRFLDDTLALTRGDIRGYAMNGNLVGLGFCIGFAEGARPTEGGLLRLSDPVMVDALQFSLDLVHQHQVAARPAAVDSEPASQQDFMNGKAAMLVDGPWMYQMYADALGDDLMLATIPSDAEEPRGLIQGSGFAVSADAEDPAAAFENLTAITTPEVIGEVAATRGTFPSVQAQEQRWNEGKPEDTVEAIVTLTRAGSPLITTPSWNQVGDLFAQYVTAGFSGDLTAQEIAESIESVVNA